MNIFVLDKNPILAAKYHCDKHVVKQILETAQILSTVHRLHGNTDNILYKSTHVNHPVVKWAGRCYGNYAWTVSLGQALCKEYTKRYGKTHKSQAIIEYAAANTPKGIKIAPLLPFEKVMPEEFKVGDAVTSYRKYYQHKVDNNESFRYNYSEKPNWLKDSEIKVYSDWMKEKARGY